jgi:hypothetical protein
LTVLIRKTGPNPKVSKPIFVTRYCGETPH